MKNKRKRIFEYFKEQNRMVEMAKNMFKNMSIIFEVLLLNHWFKLHNVKLLADSIEPTQRDLLVKKIICILTLSLYISGCSILYNQERNVELNSLTNTENLPTSKTSIFFTDLNGRLTQRRLDNNDFVVASNSEGVYLLSKNYSVSSNAVGYSKYSVRHPKSEIHLWPKSEKPLEDIFKNHHLTRINFNKKDSNCRRLCEFEGYSTQHGLHLVIFTGGYEKRREGTNSDIFVEYIDYSSRLKQVNNAIASYSKTTFPENFVPTQLISPSLVTRHITGTNSVKKLQALKSTLKSLDYNSFDNRLSQNMAYHEFDDQYSAAKRGSHEDRKAFLARYSYSQSSANCYYVKANTLNIRDRNYASSKKVGKYSKNDRVCATKETDSWVRSDRGWVFKKYLSNEPFSGAAKKLAAVADIVDKQEYANAQAEHSISAYRSYIKNNPNGDFVDGAVTKQVELYRQQKSFNGYMQAYKLKFHQPDLIAAKKALTQSSVKVSAIPELVELYFTKMVIHKNDIPNFASVTTKMNGTIYNRYVDRMMKLPSIQTQFTHDSFFNSIEYKYLLKTSRPEASVKYQLNKAQIVLDYENKQFSINTDASCSFSRSETSIRERGFLESLVTFNGDDKQTSSYDIYDCQLSAKKQAEVSNILQKLDDYQSTASIAKLNDNWEASEKTSSYTYSSTTTSGSSSSSSISPQSYVMVYFESVCGLIACKDKNLSLSGGPGDFMPGYSGAASGSIQKGYNGLAGTYQWSAHVDKKVCSGSVYISGLKPNLYIRVYDHCGDAGTSEH